VPEGLSPSEVGKEIAEHRKKAEEQEQGPAAEAKGRDRVITIIEALLLAVVAVLAAYSGFAAAKWGTESSLQLAKASAARRPSIRPNSSMLRMRSSGSCDFSFRIVHQSIGPLLASVWLGSTVNSGIRTWLGLHGDSDILASVAPRVRSKSGNVKV